METYSCAASLIVKGRTRTVRHGQQPAMECVNRPSRTGHGNRRRPSVRHRCALLAAAISPSYRSFAWRRLRACLWSDARFDRGATSGRDEFRVLFSVRCRLVVEVGAVGFPKSKQPREKNAANADRRAPWINRPTMLHRGRKCCQNLTWSRVEGTWSGKRVSLLVDAKSGLGSIVGDVHPPAGIVDRAGGRALLW